MFRKKNEDSEPVSKLGWFNKIIFFLNIVAASSLIISYLARYISPEKYWYFAFFGIGYPVLFCINLLFVMYWTIQLKKYLLLSLITILLGYNSFFSYYQFRSENIDSGAKGIKIMSYNCMLFDLYNWSNNSNSRNKIFDMLKNENPDILCLQEFYTSENPSSFNNLNDLTQSLKLKNHNYYYTTTLRKVDHWGIITLSRFPIINTGIIKFETKTNNACIFSDVVINSDTIRVYNLHLQSIQFHKKDYAYVEEVIQNKNNDDWAKSKGILRRLKKGFIKRSVQAEMVADNIKSCRYKIILCGDFNDTPTSYAYQTVRGDLTDAFIEKGSGLEKTYQGNFPAFRIDNIFHSKEIETLSFRKVKNSITDHFPITAKLKISSK